MYYYEIYVENNRGIYTYKSEEKYEIGQWCIVNFINKDKMGLIVATVNENQIQFDISKVKKIMGHRSLASTQVYTNANIEQLKKVFKTAHPRSKEINSKW